MNEKQRVQILGTAAVLVLAVGAVKALRKGSVDEPVTATTRAERNGVGAVGSAANGHSYGDLSRVYRPIVDADPFKQRSFVKPKHRPDDKKGGPGDVAAPSSSTYTPGQLTLRLTGIFVDDAGPTAVLEDRAQGKGKLVKKGDRLGDRQIAEINTSSIVLGPVPGGIAAVRTSTVEFSDRIEVALDAITISQWTVATPVSATSTGSSSNKLPELSEEKKLSVLEQLREKRKKSLNQ